MILGVNMLGFVEVVVSWYLSCDKLLQFCWVVDKIEICINGLIMCNC